MDEELANQRIATVFAADRSRALDAGFRRSFLWGPGCCPRRFEPFGYVSGVEAQEVAPLDEGDAAFGDKAADVAYGDAEVFRDLLDREEMWQRTYLRRKLSWSGSRLGAPSVGSSRGVAPVRRHDRRPARSAKPRTRPLTDDVVGALRSIPGSARCHRYYGVPVLRRRAPAGTYRSGQHQRVVRADVEAARQRIGLCVHEGRARRRSSARARGNRRQSHVLRGRRWRHEPSLRLRSSCRRSVSRS